MDVKNTSIVLNKEQLEVINELNQSMLVMAPAGTGKTMTIAKHIDLLCKAGKATEEEVLCVTFTNRACTEMQNRMTMKNVDVRTICRLYYKLVQKNYDILGYARSDITIIDPFAMREILEAVAQRMGAPNLAASPIQVYFNLMCEAAPQVTGWLHAHSYVLGNFYNRKKLRVDMSNPTPWSTWLTTSGAKFVWEVIQEIVNQQLVDYSLLMVFAYQLSQNEHTKECMSHIKYLIVDEVQDTTRTEYDILVSFFPNAIVLFCGDFNQTIYAWRGSDPQYLIRKFKADYNPKQVILFENYRSTQLINYIAQGYLDSLHGSRMVELLVPPDSKQTVYLAGNKASKTAVMLAQSWTEQYPEDSVAILARNKNMLEEIKHLAEYSDDVHVSIGTSADLDVLDFGSMRLMKDLIAVSISQSDDYSMERLFRVLGIRSLDPGMMLSDCLDGMYEPNRDRDFYADLIEGLRESRLIVFDLETTSKHIFDARVVQIAASNPRTGEMFNELVNPKCEVGESASVHGFTDEFLQLNGKDAKETLNWFRQWANDCVIVGHNVWYDINVLNEELARNGLPPLKIRRVYDTLREARKWIPERLPSYRLDVLREYLGVKVKATHNAMDDVLATQGVLGKLLTQYIAPGQKENSEKVLRQWEQMKSLFKEMRYLLERVREGSYREGLSWCCSMQRSGAPADQLLQYVHAFQLTALTQNCRNQELLISLQLKRSEVDLLMKLQNKIPAITVHQSKGCEFDRVVLLDGVSGWSTRWMYDSPETDEESRVFYVGYTRGRKEVAIVSCADTKYSVSSNIKNLPKEFLEMKEVADATTV